MKRPNSSSRTRQMLVAPLKKPKIHKPTPEIPWKLNQNKLDQIKICLLSRLFLMKMQSLYNRANPKTQARLHNSRPRWLKQHIPWNEILYCPSKRSRRLLCRVLHLLRTSMLKLKTKSQSIISLLRSQMFINHPKLFEFCSPRRVVRTLNQKIRVAVDHW